MLSGEIHMKNASLTIHKLKYKLPQPISIATYTWTHLETILVKLHYGNFVGIGEAAPFAGMTGETYDFVISQLQDFKKCSINPNATLETFYNLLQDNITSRHAAAALDGAFHDLIAKMQNMPVYKLFNNELNLTPNSMTIPILGLEETKQFVRDLHKDYPHIKLIKIKLDDAEISTEIAKVIKEEFNEKVSFVIDPNQCFKDSQQAVQVLREMQKILGNIIAIEQPVEKHNHQGLHDIKNSLAGINIYADESVVTMEDLEQIIKAKAVNGINIKIQKAGGIARAKLMANRAREAGLKVMVGCMMEGPIGIAAGIHFAVTTPNVVFTDLDSDIFLFQHFKEHVFSISPFIDGIREPFAKPGFGIEFNERALEKLAEQYEIIYEEV